jgi:hypothetical protein
MPDLSRDLRRTLATVINAAREAAEQGAADALRRLGVFESRRPAHLDEVRNETRKRLRAHARSLGDSLGGTDGEPLRRLVEAAAYVQWHRLLFGRFLLERDLLRDDLGVVTLADCRDEAGTGGDEWAVAASHTARMLPGVFPADDPVEALVLAPEHAKALRDHLARLDPATFQADDSLGWTYEFWRAAEKDRVNKSGVKIGAAELPAVTQLFTEPYMVRFLLHNTLGAWWAGKVLGDRPDLARDAADEAALRAACVLPGYAWDFLRFVREDGVWRPAAGVFPGWPRAAAAVTVLDPCCGSGHFLTEALAALAALRSVEEALAPHDAVVAALRDNLHGLEIDGRCVQIAAFALALTAWRIGGPGVRVPTPHVAWVGGPPPLPRAEFAALANGDAELRRGLETLHDLFAQAPVLGSLIEVTGGDLIDPTRVARIEDSIAALVERMRGAEPDRAESAMAARGMADAASLLSRRWVLQATNVPFLGRGRQHQALANYIAERFDVAKSDLATAMLARMRLLATSDGTIAAISPQNWFFLSSYTAFRRSILNSMCLNFSVALGEEAWESFGQRGPITTLTSYTNRKPPTASPHRVIDLTGVPLREAKIAQCLSRPMLELSQEAQYNNPDSRIVFEVAGKGATLDNLAVSPNGMHGGDTPRFRHFFWEHESPSFRWDFFQTTVDATCHFGGRSSVFDWQDGGRQHRENPSAYVKGMAAWGRKGVLVSLMRTLAVSLYTGEKFDISCAPIVPSDPDNLAAVWAFCSSADYALAVRRIDRKLNVTNATLVKIPFDLLHWQKIAAEKYPNGLPDPYSDDPTQWLFHGHPRHAAPGTELHVALVRLAGYRWPAESDPAMRLSAEARVRIAEAAKLPPGDADGLLPLVPVLGERPLADRLRAFCAAAWDDAWTPAQEAALIIAACDRAKDKPPRQLTLEAWLRNHAARQHAKLFHDRPFLWWITDGRADGFTAVAHYHRLTRVNLERLAYTVLGDWLTRLGDDPKAEAARVLQAKLALILTGEAPYDIFVRWKPLHAQPLGWDPDLDDGVRLNIRPFIQAKVLVHEPNVKYGTDRGTDVASAPWFPMFDGERRNDHHTTLAEKQQARRVP